MLKKDDKFIPLIIFALLVGFLPHILSLPTVITLWCFLLWGYLYLSVKKDLPRPKPVITFSAFLLAIIIVFFSSGRTIAGHTYIALLAVMAALKPYEIKTHRDRILTIFISYFLIIAALFASESLFITLYMFPAVLFITAILIHLNHPEGAMRFNLKLSSRIMFQAFPLMVVLFFLFPRIESSFLWQGSFGRQNRSGFNERFFVGTLSKLVQDNTVAFRAIFNDRLPENQQLYWRGIVFWLFDGKTWSRGHYTKPLSKPIYGKTRFDYTISLASHNQQWLFALDIPASTSSSATILSDHTIFSANRISRTMRYQAKSFSDVTLDATKPPQKAGLQLPRRKENKKALSMAKNWQRQFKNPSQIVKAALNFFTAQQFEYTLNPPAFENNMVDTFLFDTRKGFCEHYATAFAFLMRAAGVHTRLVGGYLGGERNPFGNYITVRQSDAHVWAEVWLENKGWVRIDPTTAVVPERVRGVADALAADELPEFLKSGHWGGFSNLLQNIQLRLDTLNILWDTWFSGFSEADQISLLKMIGIQSVTWKVKAAALIAAIGFAFVIIFYYNRFNAQPKKVRPDCIQKHYLAFCKKMERIGIKRQPYWGPLVFGNNIIALRKDLEPQVREIILLYTLLRYKEDNKKQRAIFKKRVRRFNPCRSGSA